MMINDLKWWWMVCKIWFRNADQLSAGISSGSTIISSLIFCIIWFGSYLKMRKTTRIFPIDKCGALKSLKKSLLSMFDEMKDYRCRMIQGSYIRISCSRISSTLFETLVNEPHAWSDGFITSMVSLKYSFIRYLEDKIYPCSFTTRRLLSWFKWLLTGAGAPLFLSEAQASFTFLSQWKQARVFLFAFVEAQIMDVCVEVCAFQPMSHMECTIWKEKSKDFFHISHATHLCISSFNLTIFFRWNNLRSQTIRKWNFQLGIIIFFLPYVISHF